MSEPLTFEPMTLDDLPIVLKIEQASFPNPWSLQMFEREIVHSKIAHIYTVRRKGDIVGYFSLWKIVDEGHLTNITVAPEFRRQGFGEIICREVIRLAREIRIRKVTLEVRVTNETAIRLYEKLGFIRTAVRPKYYENQIDALIMDLTIGDLTRD